MSESFKNPDEKDVITERKIVLLKKIGEAFKNAPMIALSKNGEQTQAQEEEGKEEANKLKEANAETIVTYGADMDESAGEVGLDLEEIHLYPWLIEQVMKMLGEKSERAIEAAEDNSQHEFEHLYSALELISKGTLKAKLVVKIYKVAHPIIPNAFFYACQPAARLNGSVRYSEFLQIAGGPSKLGEHDRTRLGKD